MSPVPKVGRVDFLLILTGGKQEKGKEWAETPPKTLDTPEGFDGGLEL